MSVRHLVSTLLSIYLEYPNAFRGPDMPTEHVELNLEVSIHNNPTCFQCTSVTELGDLARECG